jgi:hypothetical protein
MLGDAVMPNQMSIKKGHMAELSIFLYMNLVAVLIIAAITNPIEEKHQKTVASTVVKELGKSGVNVFAGEGARSDIIPDVIKYMIRSQSFLFFSLTKTVAGDIIGIGAFGHVFVFANTPFDD